MSQAATALADALRDRYALDRELGRGGMATVYLAQDVRHHRRVAVRVLRPELAATLGVERFLHEIETAAQFQHPHILPLLDSGEAGGFLYYVMPYVEGESLRTRLARRGELPVHEAVKALIEICDALAYAHERGIVHRDIKPDNVLLSDHHALVTDFGVAKALDEAGQQSSLTGTGLALGTPAYMAPEQAAGDPHIDQRADIYAFGVLAYEILAGHPPFTGSSAQRRNLGKPRLIRSRHPYRHGTAGATESAGPAAPRRLRGPALPGAVPIRGSDRHLATCSRGVAGFARNLVSDRRRALSSCARYRRRMAPPTRSGRIPACYRAGLELRCSARPLDRDRRAHRRNSRSPTAGNLTSPATPRPSSRTTFAGV